jgi:2-polyprenyl-3-methyl-5-hydroxy-6-metoxy-1,4-benzoquinol methylase
LRALDLATGSGDIPRMIVRFARQIKARVEVEAVDFQAATIDIARRLSANFAEIDYHCADIRDFGAPASYDLVMCSLALHHFSEAEAVNLLRRCAELSRRFVLIADLRRGWLGRFGVPLITTLFFREPMTRHDARVSMERAFSFREMHQLAQAAGWAEFGHRRFRFARQAIWLEPAQSDVHPNDHR